MLHHVLQGEETNKPHRYHGSSKDPGDEILHYSSKGEDSKVFLRILEAKCYAMFSMEKSEQT